MKLKVPIDLLGIIFTLHTFL